LATTHPNLPAQHAQHARAHHPPPQHPPDEEPGFLEDCDTEITLHQTDTALRPPVRSNPQQAILLRMDGALAGEVLTLESEQCRVGRHPTNELRLDDSGISRHHARISKANGQHFIQDLDSRNGTYVQGHRVSQSLLADGDWIQFGPRVSFRFSRVDAHEEQLLRRLFDSSTRDALTGAYNRKHFDERLRSEIAFAVRHGTEASLVLFDIDHFKGVNDSFGHQTGDAVLKQIAMLASRRLRTEDLFARYGGEEFAVILRSTDRPGAALVAERLRSTIATVPALVSGKPIPVTISAGCAALSCSREQTPSALIEVADRRLYIAKRAGRNRVVSTG
jgi:diguanylate cyclase (GGDEF)-like protein